MAPCTACLYCLPVPVLQERLEREYDLDLITTAPTVVFKAITNQGVEIIVDCPSKLPEANRLDSISEPYVRWVWAAYGRARGLVGQLGGWGVAACGAWSGRVKTLFGSRESDWHPPWHPFPSSFCRVPKPPF